VGLVFKILLVCPGCVIHYNTVDDRRNVEL